MTGVEILLREVFAAFEAGRRPDDEWLAERFTDSFLEHVPVTRLGDVMAELIAPRWNGGAGLRVVKASSNRLVADFGEDMTVTAAILDGARPRFGALKFSPRPPTSAGAVEALVREVLEAYAVGTQPDNNWVEARFSRQFLEKVPPTTLHEVLLRLVPGRWEGGAGLSDLREQDGSFVASFGDAIEVAAHVDSADPSKLTGLLFRPRSTRLTDDRLSGLRVHGRSVGDATLSEAREIADQHGLVGFVSAGTGWAIWGGWRDLEDQDLMTEDTVLCAYSLTKLVTTNVILDLVARDLVALDGPANGYLDERLSLASDAVTVRHLLTHTGCVRSEFDHFAAQVPDVPTYIGPVLAVDGEPGRIYRYSNGGFAALGHLIETVVGANYASVVVDVVFEPLGMRDSSFPLTAPRFGYDASDGIADRQPQVVATVPCAGGMWTTAGDLVRFGTGWASLLPDDLAAEAIRAQFDDIPAVGLGWHLYESHYGHTGGGTGFRAALALDRGTDEPSATLTNRQSVAIDTVNRSITTAARLTAT